MLSVRPYRDADLAGVISAWERALPLDAVTEEDFLRRVILDENREDDGLLIATDEVGTVIGFAVCLVLRHPIEKIGLIEHRGYITALGVVPEWQGHGAGRALLEAAEAFFRARNRREVTIAPYQLNYFVPGVDKVMYAKGLDWLKAHGFSEFSEGIAMDAMVGTFDLDDELKEREARLAKEGLVVRPLPRERIADYLSFMSRVMPGDWVEDARALLRDMVVGAAPAHSIFVAMDRDEIVGYCKFAGEHFGPFGVADSHQGRGVGTVLLARTLHQMRKEGHHAAFVLWTGERAAQGVYKRLGFTISRRFALLRKVIE